MKKGQQNSSARMSDKKSGNEQVRIASGSQVVSSASTSQGNGDGRGACPSRPSPSGFQKRREDDLIAYVHNVSPQKRNKRDTLNYSTFPIQTKITIRRLLEENEMSSTAVKIFGHLDVLMLGEIYKMENLRLRIRNGAKTLGTTKETIVSDIENEAGDLKNIKVSDEMANHESSRSITVTVIEFIERLERV